MRIKHMQKWFLQGNHSIFHYMQKNHPRSPYYPGTRDTDLCALNANNLVEYPTAKPAHIPNIGCKPSSTCINGWSQYNHKKSYILKLFIIDDQRYIIPRSNLAVQMQYCGPLAGLFTFHSTCCVQKKKKGIRPLGISTCIGPSSRWPIAA